VRIPTGDELRETVAMLDRVSVADEIFPSERHPDFVQTEWAEGWGYASIGVEEAVRFLTEHRAELGASIDQVGIVVFFLQRHRVELALKELLDTRKVDLREIKSPHSLSALWHLCAETLGRDSDEWVFIDGAGGELVALLDEQDRSSHTYRYPVDRDGNRHQRPPFIDLSALDKHVSNLVWAIRGFLDYAAEADQAQAYHAGAGS
jgi:hypothetical protein